MKALQTLALTVVVFVSTSAAVQAAVGTPKALGQYGGYGWTSGGSARSVHRSYAYQAYRGPVMYQAPAGESVAPEMAQIPAAGRRFSQQPSADSATLPSASSAPIYSPRPRYSAPRRQVESSGRWALPKTDARKYNGR